MRVYIVHVLYCGRGGGGVGQDHVQTQIADSAVCSVSKIP